MHMPDLIEKKKQGQTLTQEELHFIVHGYTAGDIPDYQMSALMMAIYFRGMTPEETAQLTIEMEHSGDVVDLSPLGEHTADKHSTGGVGDKTSLVLCPMVAACGGKMAKMSGRGLGHTGGTIDKLESFPGFSTAMTPEKFLENAENVGFVIAGQTANLAPADKKMYALRDVTATVDSIPLIVSSIMAKKLASGARTIVLDVKTGSGAFMETEESAFELARQMVSVGKHAGRNMAAVVTDMDQPLGFAVGNALEVKEAISVLRGWGAVLRYGEHEAEMSGGDANTTNNRMELTAVISAVERLKEPCDIKIYTDSQYVANAFLKGWIWNWKRNGWKKSDKKPVLNPELWERLLKALSKHEYEFIWVKGHAGHPENERCDRLAVAQSEKYAKK